MFPFWEPVIAPILAAGGVTTLVEIGALRGDNTRQIIDRLGPGTVLHVIDPAPGFDPTEHEREFPGRYVFHRAPSLEVLGDMEPMDAALIDGDHNWYTVYNELRLLRDSARAAVRPLPILILHDVAWPYGRRDLYYSPDSIPPEHRQPHRRAGMRPGRSDLLTVGGMSSGMWNAETEGGPRNGVMTALEDFMAEHDRPLRTVVLPLYFGLAVVVEQERLAAHPALAHELDRIEGAETRLELLELGEHVRLRGLVNHHTAVARHRDQLEELARRSIDGVVRELTAQDPSNHARLERLRAGLDDIRSRQVAGDVVVLGSSGAAVAVGLVQAYRVAHGMDAVLWVGDDAAVDTAMPLLRRLDLSEVGLRVLGTTAPDQPERLALLDATGADQSTPTWERFRRSLAADGVLVTSDP